MKRILAGFLVLLVFSSLLIGCGRGPAGEGTLTIGGKKYTEQIILVHILEQFIKDRTDLEVVNRADLGATDILQQGMLDKDLDMYVEYTGTAYAIILKAELDTTDPQVIYDRVKEHYDRNFEMTWLTPFGFNNTYAIALRAEIAEELGLEKISDLKDHAPEMVLGSDFDFLEREDGIENFNRVYGLVWKDNKGMDPGLMYSAVKNDQIDAIVAYATDGRIPRFNLKLLEDDLGFFPPYYGAVVINNEALEKHPEIAGLIDELAPHLTMEKMAELNSRVDIDGEMEAQVAREFLQEAGLLER